MEKVCEEANIRKRVNERKVRYTKSEKGETDEAGQRQVRPRKETHYTLNLSSKREKSVPSCHQYTRNSNMPLVVSLERPTRVAISSLLSCTIVVDLPTPPPLPAYSLSPVAPLSHDARSSASLSVRYVKRFLGFSGKHPTIQCIQYSTQLRVHIVCGVSLSRMQHCCSLSRAPASSAWSV